MIEISLAAHPPISAIYYGLLQTGYEYVALEREKAFVGTIRTFYTGEVPEFFKDIKQATCETYPYWPRAALLESATFYLTPTFNAWADFSAFQAQVMNARNLTSEERDTTFFEWVRRFPDAIHSLLSSPSFLMYQTWEKAWLARQEQLYSTEMQTVSAILTHCAELYDSSIRQVKLLLQPIKCVYSADYHMHGDTLYYCSGTLRMSSVIHEFLHPIVHTWLEKHQETVLNARLPVEQLDATYAKAGILYAAEELLVRKMTEDVMAGKFPKSFDDLLVNVQF